MEKLDKNHHVGILTWSDFIQAELDSCDLSEESLLKVLKYQFAEVKHVNISCITKRNYYPFESKYYGQILTRNNNNIKIRYFTIEKIAHSWSDYLIMLNPPYFNSKILKSKEITKNEFLQILKILGVFNY